MTASSEVVCLRSRCGRRTARRGICSWPASVVTAPRRSPCGGSYGALGIKAPSLYKHVPDKTALEALVVAAGFAELADALKAAAAEWTDAAGIHGIGRLEAIAGAYRAFAIAHPHVYRLMNYQPLQRDLLPAGLGDRAVQPLVEAAGYGEARARATWAFAHGMVSLEIDGRFPPGADLDEAWRAD